MKKIFIFLSGLVMSLGLFAQEISIKQIELRGDDILVHYNLQDDDPTRRYSLFLYTSLDNFLKPVELVEGDIGVDQVIGTNKILLWRAKEELGEDFSEDIALELKGSVYIPFVTLNEFEANKTVKRKVPFPITWSGGRGDNVLSIELFRGDEKMHVFEERPNNGSTSLEIPKSIKPGDDYYLKISDKTNRDEVVFSDMFSVEPKIPLVYKISGGVIGGALFLIIVDQLIPPPDIPLPKLPDGG